MTYNKKQNNLGNKKKQHNLGNKKRYKKSSKRYNKLSKRGKYTKKYGAKSRKMNKKMAKYLKKKRNNKKYTKKKHIELQGGSSTPILDKFTLQSIFKDQDTIPDKELIEIINEADSVTATNDLDRIIEYFTIIIRREENISEEKKKKIFQYYLEKIDNKYGVFYEKIYLLLELSPNDPDNDPETYLSRFLKYGIYGKIIEKIFLKYNDASKKITKEQAVKELNEIRIEDFDFYQNIFSLYHSNRSRGKSELYPVYFLDKYPYENNFTELLELIYYSNITDHSSLFFFLHNKKIILIPFLKKIIGYDTVIEGLDDFIKTDLELSDVIKELLIKQIIEDFNKKEKKLTLYEVINIVIRIYCKYEDKDKLETFLTYNIGRDKKKKNILIINTSGTLKYPVSP